jgi:hypothetical protein
MIDKVHIIQREKYLLDRLKPHQINTTLLKINILKEVRIMAQII